ncbi:alpha/beta fold hydrolase [Paenibacillus terrigena]|uniref:alpha/beta fold hydrolase n=1 Tax=Paenibacillus terrigena TaxID=369333 RepID=UPI00035D089F|nr:alpha/beta hydrolase [Paenibacillus terrigena]
METVMKEDLGKDSFHYSTVISQDGTQIGYRSIGHGPGLIVVPGALTTSAEFTTFARYLSDTFTVHILDRRGRGESGPQGTEYSIRKECEDIMEIQALTGATYLFGHSYGGLAVLETVLANQTFEKIALYEPGVVIHSDPADWNWLSEYEEDMRRKDYRGAFTTFVQGASHNFLSRIPKWFADLNLRIGIRGEHWNRIMQLLPENLIEHKEVQRLASTYRKYEAIPAEILLMSGMKSPKSVHHMIHELDHTIKRTQMMTIPKLHHLSPENDYSPIQVAQPVKAFFLS